MKKIFYIITFLILLLVILLFSSIFVSASEDNGNKFCGTWKITKKNGLYQNFTFFNNGVVAITPKKKSGRMQYYIVGDIIHIPHSRGGELLLAIGENEKLLGLDSFTSKSEYEKISEDGC